MIPAVERLRLALAGRYDVQREIGRGGMATVYLARDLRHDRLVAVKILDGEVAAAVGADRFLNEIQIAAGLTHPHILPVHDSGNADGVLFYIMPFIDGESLRHRLLREKQLPVADAIRIAREVAQALDYAHRHDVVHRDVKPENILLQDGHAFVADFGIARTIVGSSGLTQTGQVVGTVLYMSPEQASGQPIDGRSDLYSLGCVLYDMLAGIQPFTGAVQAQRLTIAGVRALRPNVPPAVEQALATALAISPADRFRTGGDFAAALHDDRAAVTPPIDVAPAPIASQDRRRTGRLRKAGLGLLAVAALAVTSYLVLMPQGARGRDALAPAALPATTTPSIAVLPFVNISADSTNEYFSDGMTEELINALSRIQGLRVTSRTSAFTFKGTSANARDIAGKLGVAWLLEGSVRKAGTRLKITAQLIDVRDDSHKWSDTYERELSDVFAIQNEIARAIVTALSVHLAGDARQALVKAPTQHLAAYQLYLEGRYFWNKRDEASLMRAIGYFEQALSLDPNYALAHAGLGDAYVILGGNGHRRPADVYPQAKASLTRALALDSSLAQPHATLGLVLTQYDWDFQRALDEYRLAEQLNPSYATVPHWRAWTLVALGRVDEALAEMRRAQTLDPLSLVINTQIGTMFHYLRRYDDADRVYRKALELDPGFALAHSYLAANDARRHQFDSALKEARLASGQFGQASAVRLLGPIYASAGRKQDAEGALKELGELSARAYVSDVDFATIHALLGNRDEAFAWLERALEARASDLFVIRVDPVWDGLRDDPRFQQVLRRISTT